MSRCRNEGGQLLPLVAVVLVLGAGMCVVVAELGGAALLRARAVTAADAAALAGAVAGERAAREVAAANGARVESVERVGGNGRGGGGVGDVRVRVALGRARASARARPAPLPGGAAGHGLAPALRAALDAAGRLLGRPVPVTSGFRSRAEQASLFARRHLLPYPVAPPGRSEHERGLAVDVPRSFVPTLLRVASRVGLCRPYPTADPVHFELCRVPGRRAGAG